LGLGRDIRPALGQAAPITYALFVLLEFRSFSAYQLHLRASSELVRVNPRASYYIFFPCPLDGGSG